MYCQNCGQDLKGGETVCPNCGESVIDGTAVPAADQPNAGDSLPTQPPVANGSSPPSWSQPAPVKPRNWKHDLWVGFVAFLFVFLGVPSCLGGGCLLLLNAGSSSANVLTILIAAGLIALSGVLLYLLIKVNRDSTRR